MGDNTSRSSILLRGSLRRDQDSQVKSEPIARSCDAHGVAPTDNRYRSFNEACKGTLVLIEEISGASDSASVQVDRICAAEVVGLGEDDQPPSPSGETSKRRRTR